MVSREKPQGMSKLMYSIELRDVFAAAAITGVLSNPNNKGLTFTGMARAAYAQADALLAERKRLDEEDTTGDGVATDADSSPSSTGGSSDS